MDDIRKSEEDAKAAAEEEKRLAKIAEQKAKEEAKARAKKEKEQAEWSDKLARKAKNKLENEALNIGLRSAKKFLQGLLK